ncbi:MAG TPA: DUF4435 domain-containing protein [Terriglobales bacterium]|nr:DUF4435 domain-containing protein [Terriglobales bacterium]
MTTPSAVTLANQIRMGRQISRRAVVVVEGRDDKLFCEHFVDRAVAKVLVAPGKENVLEAVRILDADGFLGISGLVDPDFDGLSGFGVGSAPSPNLLTVDAHDLDTMLLRSGALGRVLTEFAVRRDCGPSESDVREMLTLLAAPIGCLRLHSLRRGLNLRFAGLDYSRVFSRTGGSVDEITLIQEVKNRTQRQDISSAELRTGVAAIREEGHDLWQLCCGDDLLGALCCALRWWLAGSSAQQVSAAKIRESLRLAFGPQDFLGSGVGRQMSFWQEQNPGFRLLLPALGRGAGATP